MKELYCPSCGYTLNREKNDFDELLSGTTKFVSAAVSGLPIVIERKNQEDSQKLKNIKNWGKTKPVIEKDKSLSFSNKKCPKCKISLQINPMKEHYCPSCGYTVNREKGSKSELLSSIGEMAEGMVSQIIYRDEKKPESQQLKNIKNWNKSNIDLDNKKKSIENEMKIDQSKEKICSKCGSKVDIDSNYCNSCGSQL